MMGHCFVFLFATDHADQYAPNVIVCPLGRSWHRGPWDRERRERNKEADVQRASTCSGGVWKVPNHLRAYVTVHDGKR